jgi:hypothetical protein
MPLYDLQTYCTSYDNDVARSLSEQLAKDQFVNLFREFGLGVHYSRSGPDWIQDRSPVAEKSGSTIWLK